MDQINFNSVVDTKFRPFRDAVPFPEFAIHNYAGMAILSKFFYNNLKINESLTDVLKNYSSSAFQMSAII